MTDWREAALALVARFRIRRHLVERGDRRFTKKRKKQRKKTMEAEYD